MTSVVSLHQGIQSKAKTVAQENAEIREQLRKLEEMIREEKEDLELYKQDITDILEAKCDLLDELIPEFNRIRACKERVVTLLEEETMDENYNVNSKYMRELEDREEEIQRELELSDKKETALTIEVSDLTIELNRVARYLKELEYEYEYVQEDLEAWEKICSNTDVWSDSYLRVA